MHIGSLKDKFFKGIHLYICEDLPEVEEAHLLQEEPQLWPHLHFQIAVATGTLADGQSALIKIGSTFTQRTIEYMYLLKLSFSRLTFFKWIGSNIFTCDKYVIC